MIALTLVRGGKAQDCAIGTGSRPPRAAGVESRKSACQAALRARGAANSLLLRPGPMAPAGRINLCSYFNQLEKTATCVGSMAQESQLRRWIFSLMISMIYDRFGSRRLPSAGSGEYKAQPLHRNRFEGPEIRRRWSGRRHGDQAQEHVPRPRSSPQANTVGLGTPQFPQVCGWSPVS